MSNVFSQTRAFNEKSKRNNFDLSFQNHLTMKFGTLYPVFCKEVVPGDSFSIETAMGLKFMPLVFPVQSRMRATMHFFYCRNKNLWKNWENWLMNLEDHVHPYIQQDASFYKTGSLADYLDVPTTLVSSETQLLPIHGVTAETIRGMFVGNDDILQNISNNILVGHFINFISSGLSGVPYERFVNLPESQSTTLAVQIPFSTPILSPIVAEPFRIAVSAPPQALSGTRVTLVVSYTPNGEIGDSVIYNSVRLNITPTDNPSIFNLTGDSALATLASSVNELVSAGNKVYFTLVYDASAALVLTYITDAVNNFDKSGNFWAFTDSLLVPSIVTLPRDLSSTGVNPYGKGTNQVALNALPFRAYESIYQAFYRNTQNQDFLIDGQPVYNRYNTTLEDGADTTPYHLFQRNYEMDYLTGAFPSPQQGNAPVIGMSVLGDITLEDEDGITTAHAEVGEDGDTITGITITSPVASQGHRVALAELASAGFTISSFREGNALTRWLEMNMRKGYRYLDFIEGHHNVRPSYKELDMPEFIGGFSRDVTVNSILNQTASPDSEPLGSFAGTANCFAGSSHPIRHYCDDYGWIIGILCVTPTPAYSQLLPKQMLKNSPLDYYFSEFSQLGMQPITYEEVCPVQSYIECQSDESKSMRDTFGYQRPNYDLVAYTDQVHGNFRTDMRNFLINRVFGMRPELGNDFLQIKPEETNDIFAVTTPDNDTIAGQLVFRVFAKRPIPRVSIPSLGR